MLHRIRVWAALSAAVLALAGCPAVIATIPTPAVANADVCAGVHGRFVGAGGCADLADPVADYVPPPAYYAPMPYDPPPPVDYDYVAPPPPPPVPGGCAEVHGYRFAVGGCN